MNRICQCLVSFACAAPLVLSGCLGNPFAYRDSLLKSRAPGEQREPRTETVDSKRFTPDKKTGTGSVVQTRHEQDPERDRADYRMDRQPERQNPEVSEMMQRAEDALAAGNRNKAAGFYQEVVRLQPAHKGALHRLAILYDEKGNFPQAEIHFRRALEVAPHDPDLLNDIGYAYLRQERLEESEYFLQSSINLDPHNRATLGNLGLLYAMLGNPQAAEEFFQRAGLSPEAAHREYASFLASISKPPERDVPSINDLDQARNPSLVSGQFAPPSPDWESTYGLKSQTPLRNAASNSFDDRNQPGIAGTANRPRAFNEFPTAAVHTNASREGEAQTLPEVRAGSGRSNHDLERAILNAGPGSLFPIAAFDSPENRDQEPDPPFAGLHDWDTIQPVGFGESAPFERRKFPNDDAGPSVSSRAPREPRFIQTPPGRETAADPATTGSTGFPVTRHDSTSQSRITPSYYQFPGSGSTQPTARAPSGSDDSFTQFPAGAEYR